MVVGDRRPYVAALITLDPTVTGNRPRAELEEEIGRIVDAVNVEFSRFEQIKRFRVLERDFSMEEGEITPTLKLKRRVVTQRYADEIEGLYLGRRRQAADPARRSRRPGGRLWQTRRVADGGRVAGAKGAWRRTTSRRTRGR